jgi:hypothetical protein
VDVDAIHERTGDFRDVSLDHRRSALAISGSVIVKSAGAGIHGCGKHEARGERQGHRRACNGHGSVLERLAQDFQNISRELREFIQKKQTVVREGNFARPRDHAAADQARVRIVGWGERYGRVPTKPVF